MTSAWTIHPLPSLRPGPDFDRLYGLHESGRRLLELFTSYFTAPAEDEAFDVVLHEG